VKILVVTPMPPRRDAPAAIPGLLHAMIAGLREQHEVTLVTVFSDEPGDADAAADLLRSGLDIHAVDARLPSGAARWARRRRFVTTWARGAYPWRTVWFADPLVQETIDRLTRERRFDLAAVEDNSMGIFRFPRELPTVLSEYEVRTPRPVDWRCGPPSAWPGWVFREADWRRWPDYQRSVWSSFDRVQVFTDRDAAAVGRIAPEIVDRVRVNPFGIDLPEHSDAAGEEDGVLLFVGNFAHPPNVDAARWLIDDIMPLLRARNTGARLRIVGPGAPADVRAQAGPDVEILGEVPSVEPFLEAASVVLAPLRIGGGMRMKALHALAAGKALVTTSRGAEGLAVDGVKPPFLTADEPDAFASLVAELLDDINLRRELGGEARAFVSEHYSSRAYGRRLEGVYGELIAERAQNGAAR
jgi:glycosyltransferase involved in cell wall biosynthesis